MANGSSKGWIGQAIGSGSIRAIAFQITLTYILPIGAPIVTAYLGYVQGLPSMYIWLGALVAFAVMAHGLLKYDEWRQRRRVKDKLSFQSVVVGRIIKDDGVILGLQLLTN